MITSKVACLQTAVSRWRALRPILLDCDGKTNEPGGLGSGTPRSRLRRDRPFLTSKTAGVAAIIPPALSVPAFSGIKNGIFAHPTPLGEEIIAAITGGHVPQPAIPAFNPPDK
jgi:hypothetical protein